MRPATETAALSPPPDPSLYLGFQLGELRRYVAAPQVVRIAEIDRLFRVPGDLECNLGLAIHGDVAVGVVDLEVLLDLRPTRRGPPWPEPPFSCVFGRFPRGIAGFAVDRLLGLGRQVDPDAVIDLSTVETFR